MLPIQPEPGHTAATPLISDQRSAVRDALGFQLGLRRLFTGTISAHATA